MEALTILSFGAGQDSTCILYRIIRDPAYRAKWVRGDFIVIMSNTGNEHPHTYRHIRYIRQLCKEHGIPFFFLASHMGYHPKTWKSLVHQFRLNDTIMSMMFPRSCSDNLKIKPIYNFLDHHIARKYYGYTDEKRPKGKKYIKRFHREHGRIRVIIGIAAGEEKRIAKANRKKLLALQLDLFNKPARTETAWMRDTIEKVYPLVAEGIDRAGCQAYIRSTGWPLPYPSNCMMCPYISKIELLWLYRNIPDEYRKWAALERNKLRRCRGNGKRNLGVKGEKTLDEILAEAIAEYGGMTDEQVDDYKMSHGHCVLSKF